MDICTHREVKWSLSQILSGIDPVKRPNSILSGSMHTNHSLYQKFSTTSIVHIVTKLLYIWIHLLLRNSHTCGDRQIGISSAPNRSYTFAKISVNQLVQQQTNNLPLQLDSEHVYSGLLWQLEGAQPFWARVYEPRLDSTRAINFKKSCTCMGGWSTNFLMRCENPQQVERCG